MNIVETKMTMGTAFPVSLTASIQDLSIPVNVSVLSVTSQEMQGDYVQIIIDGVDKGKVRIK